MSLFCKHKHSWEVVSDTVTESTFEMTLRVTSGSGRVPPQLCQDNRKHIIVLKCECGEFKKIVTELS